MTILQQVSILAVKLGSPPTNPHGKVDLTALPRSASISELCEDLEWREVNVHRGKQPWKSGWKNTLNVASPIKKGCEANLDLFTLRCSIFWKSQPQKSDVCLKTSVLLSHFNDQLSLAKTGGGLLFISADSTSTFVWPIPMGAGSYPSTVNHMRITQLTNDHC